MKIYNPNYNYDKVMEKICMVLQKDLFQFYKILQRKKSLFKPRLSNNIG